MKTRIKKNGAKEGEVNKYEALLIKAELKKLFDKGTASRILSELYEIL